MTDEVKAAEARGYSKGYAAGNQITSMMQNLTANENARLRAEVAAMREALDALKAENEMLREALKDADSEMDWLDEDMDTCDHSVGVCMCSYWTTRRKMKAALAREDKHD